MKVRQLVYVPWYRKVYVLILNNLLNTEELFELVQLSGVPMDKELFKVVSPHDNKNGCMLSEVFTLILMLI